MSKVKWKNHIREFIVVVFSILLAFQLDRCSDSNSQQKLIKSHLDYLKEETELNSINLKYALKYSKINLNKLDSIISFASQKQNVELINKLCFDILDAGYLYIRKNAYNSLINSGDIRYLKSFKKKKEIINLYEYYSWTESIDEACRITYSNDFLPYVKENFDLINKSIQKDSIYYSKKFLNALSTYRFSLKLKIKKFQECEKEINTFFKDLN